MNSEYAWLGLWRVDDINWRWSDGTLYFRAGTLWNKFQPSKDGTLGCCFLMRSEMLYSTECRTRIQYVCKRRLDETPVTIPECPAAIPECPAATILKCPDVTCPIIPPCPPCPNLTLPTIPAPTTCPPSPPATTCPPCTTPTVALLLPADPSPTTQTSTNWELVTCGSPTGQPSCSSRNVTCSCLLAMVANPKGGFQAAMDEGLAVGRSIVIRGRAKTNVTRFLFNLNVHKDGDGEDDGDDGEDDGDDGDDGGGDSGNKITTGLHLKFDLAKQMVLLNSKVAGTWGNKQTKNLPQHRPFGPGHAFKIVIKCEVDAFNITFNDDLQLDLKYAVSDLQSINWLEGWQVMLTSVQLV
ncbi:uncharacterized protein LOC133159789 [Syngnathus typhle]|uniref:uncharacterized protein LOC133159789 n=1 Tax=Syngnathus typhle TaxID=161592 RepID=UPI002A6B5743|nr:uncharacterized protein LOC133159789 [Syngnathus typhle]